MSFTQKLLDATVKLVGSIYGEMVACLILKRGLSKRTVLDWQRRLRQIADDLDKLIN